MRQYSGGALISALFITAIAAMLATALAVSQRFLIHEEQLITRSDQLYLQLQGEQALASQVIKNHVMQWRGSQNPNARYIPLKNELPDTQDNGVIVSGVIDEVQGKYNINNLIYSANQAGFVALMQALIPAMQKDTAFNIAKSMTAWETTGSQDPYYLSLNPAYRSSKNEMANISELRLIAGITPEIYAAIAPFITALPIPKPTETPATAQPTAPTFVGMPININSASPVALLAVNPTLTMGQAQAIIACRDRYGGFTALPQFVSACVQTNGIASVMGVVTQSQYFLVKTQASLRDHVVSLNSLMVTQMEKNNKLKLVTVWQAFE